MIHVCQHHVAISTVSKFSYAVRLVHIVSYRVRIEQAVCIVASYSAKQNVAWR